MILTFQNFSIKSDFDTNREDMIKFIKEVLEFCDMQIEYDSVSNRTDISAATPE